MTFKIFQKNIHFIGFAEYHFLIPHHGTNLPNLIEKYSLYLILNINNLQKFKQLMYQTSLITIMSSSNTIQLFMKRNGKWFILELRFRLNLRLKDGLTLQIVTKSVWKPFF